MSSTKKPKKKEDIVEEIADEMKNNRFIVSQRPPPGFILGNYISQGSNGVVSECNYDLYERSMKSKENNCVKMVVCTFCENEKQGIAYDKDTEFKSLRNGRLPKYFEEMKNAITGKKNICKMKDFLVEIDRTNNSSNKPTQLSLITPKFSWCIPIKLESKLLVESKVKEELFAVFTIFPRVRGVTLQKYLLEDEPKRCNLFNFFRFFASYLQTQITILDSRDMYHMDPNLTNFMIPYEEEEEEETEGEDSKSTKKEVKKLKHVKEEEEEEETEGKLPQFLGKSLFMIDFGIATTISNVDKSTIFETAEDKSKKFLKKLEDSVIGSGKGKGISFSDYVIKQMKDEKKKRKFKAFLGKLRVSDVLGKFEKDINKEPSLPISGAKAGFKGILGMVNDFITKKEIFTRKERLKLYQISGKKDDYSYVISKEIGGLIEEVKSLSDTVKKQGVKIKKQAVKIKKQDDKIKKQDDKIKKQDDKIKKQDGKIKKQDEKIRGLENQLELQKVSFEKRLKIFEEKIKELTKNINIPPEKKVEEKVVEKSKNICSAECQECGKVCGNILEG